MNPVIRRMLFLGLVLVALSGCAGSDRNALAIGETSLSEDGLIDMVIALNGGAPTDEPIPAISADVSREIADIVIRDLASVEYLRQSGVVLSDDERETFKEQIEAAIVEGRLGPLDRSSEGYDAITYNIWIASQPGDITSPDAQDAIAQLVRDADISSRLGEIDPESRLLVPRG